MIVTGKQVTGSVKLQNFVARRTKEYHGQEFVEAGVDSIAKWCEYVKQTEGRCYTTLSEKSQQSMLDVIRLYEKSTKPEKPVVSENNQELLNNMSACGKCNRQFAARERILTGGFVCMLCPDCLNKWTDFAGQTKEFENYYYYGEQLKYFRKHGLGDETHLLVDLITNLMQAERKMFALGRAWYEGETENERYEESF